MAPTRQDLIAAQVAIFENQDREEADGIDYETDEFLRLHEAYYNLAEQVPWYRRLGVWSSALRKCRS